MGTRIIVLIAVWLVTQGAPARADSPKLLAVLPLDASHTESRLSPAGRVAFEEFLRDIAANMLSSTGWIVMSGENALQILTDNGIDPTKCDDQSCHLGLARELKVEKFISGAVLFVDGQLLASIRLLDTSTGRIVGSVRLKGTTITELQLSFEGKATAFFSRCGLIEQASSVLPLKDRVTESLSGLLLVHRDGIWSTEGMVPVDAYARCVWAGACFEPEHLVSEDCNWKRRRSAPVNCLDSSRARQFCDWMGGRLPALTEAKSLKGETLELPAALFSEGERLGVRREAGAPSWLPSDGNEPIDARVGFRCVFAPESVRRLTAQ
jgi:hypothetical protein